MSKASMPLNLRAALVALAAIAMFAISATSASAVNVHLRIEGQTTTHFSGDVTTAARSVPGNPNNPNCAADEIPAVFATPNAITAAADALGDSAIGTTGTFYGWGTMLCRVNSEAPADKSGGWLVRINQQDSTAPNGYVTATDPLSNNDSVVLFFSPSYGFYTSSLELRLPASAKPGQPVTGYVDSYDTSTDAKSAGSGVAVTGGGASASSGTDGSFQLTFPAEGKYLIAANKSGAIRGSQWVTVAAEAAAPPVKPVTQKEVNKQRRIAARAKCRASNKDRTSDDYKRCIRVANQLGHTKTAKQKRIEARERCVHLYPMRRSASRVTCVREANAIGR